MTEKQTVTVKYAGKTATFDVEIRNIIIPEPEPTHADGLANEMAEDGKWYVYRDNAVDYGYTGLAANEYGWFYGSKRSSGLLSYTGLAANEYGWFMVVNGAARLWLHRTCSKRIWLVHGSKRSGRLWLYRTCSKQIWLVHGSKTEQ